MDHIGIVEKCDGKTASTIEENSFDAVIRQKYRIGFYELFGYGVPKYYVLRVPHEYHKIIIQRIKTTNEKNTKTIGRGCSWFFL